ncbi:hypothetical protein [Paenibacillus methanolicus]|uniref:Uncharacterized protein n=1 Tax=Paenibacillus methanolicus TaxID=582686 RepID=A0A5S5C894_9BACL|nr:hypothetical protein [Paenibacillus methanolicus]TYP75527.1 hypothetical protein BCM02_104205 [Paenibacillus methanolicus]
MIKELRQSFFQTFTLTSLWVTLLLSLFYKDQSITTSYLWSAAGIALIAAFLFGMMYNALWNYFTLKPAWNILIASTLNIAGGLAMVWLFSKEMYDSVIAWWPGMVVLSLALHTAAFYFYAKSESKRRADELNKRIK